MASISLSVFRFDGEYQVTAANGGIASLLQSARLVAAVAEFWSLATTHHIMKYTRHIIGLAALLLAVGCASTSNLPSGAKKVGGGLKIDWAAPADGTAIFVETTTGKTVATKSVSPGGAGFHFDISREEDADVVKAVFSGMPTEPTNAQFVLYFVPVPKQK